MKKAFFILLLLSFPLLVQAESMIKVLDTNTSLEIENSSFENETSSQDDQEKNEEKETTVINITVDLPDIKILPSNPLYFFKKAWENVRGWFIFNTVKKAEYGIDLANRRLEEIESLAQKKKTDLINKTTNQFNKQMEEVNKNIEKAKNKGKDLNKIYDLLEINQEKHQAVFNQLLGQIPEEAKEAFNKAKEISQKGFEIAKEKIGAKGVESGLEEMKKVKEGLDVLGD